MPLRNTFVAVTGDKKRGMTLGEWGAFVDRARELGGTDQDVPEVTTVGWGRLRIKTAKVVITDSGEDSGAGV